MADQFTVFDIFAALGTAATIFGGGVGLGARLNKWTFEKEREKLQASVVDADNKTKVAQVNLAGVRSILDDKTDIWLRSAPDLATHLSEIRSSIPIITVCNFKGGVGKTTLTSLLAGYFDLHQSKRVLLIDFDYQGSLTDTLLASADLPQFEASSRRLFETGLSPENAVAHAYSLHPALSKTKLFSCFYGFNRIENTVMMRWIAEGAEARYLTHEVLSSPAVQTAFDVVIIDAPPRLSTATVNALCASTHVLVPTILDSMSTQAALNTLNVVQDFREKLNPGLEVLGIAPTLVAAAELNSREQDYLERMVARLPDYWRTAPLPHVFKDQRICRRAAISTALGRELAFNSSSGVRDMTIALGDAISERLFTHASEAVGSTAEANGNVTSIGAGRRRA